MSPLSNNLRRGALTLIHNQTIWLDYHPHNQIRCLWADYHRGAQRPAVFGLRYSLHIEALCDGPAVCGKPGLGSVLWLCVCVYVLKGVIVITWPAAHTDRGTDVRRLQRRVTAEGTGWRLCVYMMWLLWNVTMRAVECANVSRKAAGRIESLHESVLLDMLRELDQKIEKKNQACSFFFFFFSYYSDAFKLLLIPHPADLKCCGQATTRTTTTNKQKRPWHTFLTSSPPPPSVLPSAPRKATRSPTAWTAGTLCGGPRWRWAPTPGSSPSPGCCPSRPTSSNWSLAPLWAGAKRRRRWWSPPNAEVKGDVRHPPLISPIASGSLERHTSWAQKWTLMKWTHLL